MTAWQGRDFLEILDLSDGELAMLLQWARRLRDEPDHLTATSRQGVGLVFEKPSLRTRSSFAVAAWRLGLLPVYLSPQEVDLGRRESLPDAARNLDKFFDLVVHRTFGHGRVVELARHAAVPVVNALSDHEHPCQALADLLTLEDRFGRLEGLRLAYVGDGNNVAHSLMGACALAGVEMRAATPAAHAPNALVVEAARRVARAPLELMTDPLEAVEGAHAVYTDTWISMGQEDEAAARRAAFAGYRVDADLMSRAREDAVFLHCLPAHRGEEVTDEVMDSAASVVFDQAANRLPVQHALMAALLGLLDG